MAMVGATLQKGAVKHGIGNQRAENKTRKHDEKTTSSIERKGTRMEYICSITHAGGKAQLVLCSIHKAIAILPCHERFRRR